MTVQTAQRSGGGYLERPAPSGLADVIEIILDKGIVIDAYVRVSLVGIELLTIDARIVIASVDTYLRFAEATNRLDLYEQGRQGPDRGGRGPAGERRRARRSAAPSRASRRRSPVARDDDDDDDRDERPRRSSSRARRRPRMPDDARRRAPSGLLRLRRGSGATRPCPGLLGLDGAAGRVRRDGTARRGRSAGSRSTVPPAAGRSWWRTAQVVDALADAGAVVPVRFGSVMEDEDERGAGPACAGARPVRRPARAARGLRAVQPAGHLRRRTRCWPRSCRATRRSRSCAAHARPAGGRRAPRPGPAGRAGLRAPWRPSAHDDADDAAGRGRAARRGHASCVRARGLDHVARRRRCCVDDEQSGRVRGGARGPRRGVHERIRLRLTGPVAPYDFVGAVRRWD